jgi:hypothetical protein
MESPIETYCNKPRLRLARSRSAEIRPRHADGFLMEMAQAPTRAPCPWENAIFIGNLQKGY